MGSKVWESVPTVQCNDVFSVKIDGLAWLLTVSQAARTTHLSPRRWRRRPEIRPRMCRLGEIEFLSHLIDGERRVQITYIGGRIWNASAGAGGGRLSAAGHRTIQNTTEHTPARNGHLLSARPLYARICSAARGPAPSQGSGRDGEYCHHARPGPRGSGVAAEKLFAATRGQADEA
jgi:hypothetical protein